MDEILANSLSSVDKDFRSNELAYLALTTKIEHPLRDRWAFRLFKEFFDKQTVSREWLRTDLAILENGNPLALIELKAMYTFDAALDPEGIRGFCDAMDDDITKASHLADKSTDIYTVLLATHPKQKIEEKLEGVVKYMSSINRAIELYGSEEAVAEQAIDAVNKRLKNNNIISSGVLSGGEAFTVPTDVYYWLVRA